MTALVIGYGSIGARHARLLAEMGHTVAVVSRRPLEVPRCHGDLAAALTIERPGYVVVANATAEHEGTLRHLAELGYDGRVLVEKPLFARCHALPAQRFSGAWVGYNLRFHPVVQALRPLLTSETVIAAQFAVGQHLSQWRPERDYATTYSASAEAGGGVLRDLSHELDLAAWLLGTPRRLTAQGGRLGDLAMDADDAWTLLVEHEHCPLVSIHINCLERTPRRDIHLTTLRHSIHADLIAGRLWLDGVVQDVVCGRDDSYRAMHRAALDDGQDLCCLEAGQTIMSMIEAAETAARKKIWVNL